MKNFIYIFFPVWVTFFPILFNVLFLYFLSRLFGAREFTVFFRVQFLYIYFVCIYLSFICFSFIFFQCFFLFTLYLVYMYISKKIIVISYIHTFYISCVPVVCLSCPGKIVVLIYIFPGLLYFISFLFFLVIFMVKTFLVNFIVPHKYDITSVHHSLPRMSCTCYLPLRIKLLIFFI